MQQTENHLTITGKIRYNMTNDYMFCSILQSNPKILRGLLSSLLHIHPDEMNEITIENPILLGESFKDKKYILDILVKLNKSALINLEMQLLNKHNWNERSLLYLCRVFSNLESGEEYSNVTPATHIGFVNFTAAPNKPQFYSTYKLLDTRTHHVYSDKLVLSVVDLTQIELATDEDKAYQIDKWAKIFKADTWEELHMLTKDNEYMEEITKALYNCNMDPKICKQCQDWEFEQKLIKMEENHRKQLSAENAQLIDENIQLYDKNIQLNDKNMQLHDENSLLQDENSLLQDENSLLQDENSLLQDENSLLQDKNSQLQNKNSQLQDKNSQLQDEIAQLKAKLAAFDQ